VFEHTVDGVQEFTFDRDQGLHFQFAVGQQVLVESPQVGIMADGDEGRHVEAAAQVAVAGLADANFFVHRGAGGTSISKFQP